MLTQWFQYFLSMNNIDPSLYYLWCTWWTFVYSCLHPMHSAFCRAYPPSHLTLSASAEPKSEIGSFIVLAYTYWSNCQAALCITSYHFCCYGNKTFVSFAVAHYFFFPPYCRSFKWTLGATTNTKIHWSMFQYQGFPPPELKQPPSILMLFLRKIWMRR